MTLSRLVLLFAVFASLAAFAPSSALATAATPPDPAAASEEDVADSEAAAASEQATADAASGGEAEAAAPSFARRVWIFLGVFHPLVVHFPIALLLLAAMVEVARLLRIIDVSRDVTWICLVGGAGTAVLAATLGWSNAATMGDSPTLTSHRWLGVGMTGLAVVLAIVATVQRYRPHITPGRVYLATLLALAGGIGFTGHLGGQLVYGDDFIERAWRNATAPVAPRADAAAVTSIDDDPEEAADANEAEPVTPLPDLDDPEAEVDFAQHVWPILESKCIECHGPEVDEGRLRLHTEAAALEGGRGGPAYMPGDPEYSLMIEMITSPFEADIMPPVDHENPVTDQELAVLQRWIEQGAEWNRPE